MLTASSDVRSRVSGLTLGADDYLTKPFAFEELVARVHALGRRSRPAEPPKLERGPNTVRVTLMKLRRKLGDPPVIDTVPGVGYRFS